MSYLISRRRVGGNGFNLLRHGELQNAVSVLGLNAVHVHAGHVKAPAVGTVETLALDEVLLLFILVQFALGGNGKAVVLNVDLDIFLLEAGSTGISAVNSTVKVGTTDEAGNFTAGDVKSENGIGIKADGGSTVTAGEVTGVTAGIEVDGGTVPP